MAKMFGVFVQAANTPNIFYVYTAAPRDVEDAVPYGCVAVGWAHNCGRGKPLPYGSEGSGEVGVPARPVLYIRFSVGAGVPDGPASELQTGNDLRENLSARS